MALFVPSFAVRRTRLRLTSFFPLLPPVSLPPTTVTRRNSNETCRKSSVPALHAGRRLAYAQQGVIQHIIIAVQENRTPDDLFQDPNLVAHGADIVPISTGGLCTTSTFGTLPIPLQSRPLSDCVNPSHNHNTGWLRSYDNGQMDGACTEPYSGSSCSPPLNPCPNRGYRNCPQYAYVDNSSGTIQPYWDIAEKYGYANYMFQTSQGPSFPAHQFLISGSSQPDGILNPFYQYFAAENIQDGTNNNMQDAGCAATNQGANKATVQLVSPTQDESTVRYPCFEHPTLTDLLDQNTPAITWRYYGDQARSIWTAPNAISHICNNDANNDGCGTGTGSNHDWNNNVGPNLEGSLRNHQSTLAPFLYDLQNCDLKQVTWVVPDGRWSDHPVENLGLGPDYVADIVNAVGGTGPPTNNCGFWNNTVILIVWDDWGGWYDHVSPAAPTGPGIGYANNTGGQYVYGFRVPLLVVSAYNKQTSQSYTGYISGTKQIPIFYDFGSILKFIENTFLPPQTFINPIYPYADQFVDTGTQFNDLSDFFQCFTQACKNTFRPIALVPNPQYCNTNQGSCGQTSCNAACFINFPGSPRNPDDE